MYDFDLLSQIVHTYASKTDATTQKSDSDNNDCLVGDKIGKVYDVCKHAEFIVEGNIKICIGCGEEFEKLIHYEKEWRFNGSKLNGNPVRVQMRRVDVKSIQKDVHSMNFNHLVIEKADKIFKDAMKGVICRGDSRKARIFASIYYAYKLTGNPQSKEQLRKTFNISNPTASDGIKFIELNSPDSSDIHNAYTTTADLILDVMSKFKTSDKQKQQVVSLYKKIRNRSSDLNQARPYSVTCALIFYWMKRKKINIKLSQFVSIVKLGETTITRLVNTISGIFGKSVVCD